jgi:hypothetical protein
MQHDERIFTTTTTFFHQSNPLLLPPQEEKKKKNTTPKHQHQYITPYPSLLFVFQENSNRKNTPTKYFWEINC